MPRNKHKRNWERVAVVHWLFHWVVAPKGAVCVFECLSANLALQEFFQAINFRLTRTTKHQHTRNLSLFFTTFMANLSTALSGSCSAWSFSPIAGFQTSLYPWYPQTAESTMARPWPRLLPTFKATKHLFVFFSVSLSLDLINVKDSYNFYVGVSKPWLFVAIQLYWNFKLYCFYFFPNSVLPNWGCGLSTDAAYTWMFTVSCIYQLSICKINQI